MRGITRTGPAGVGFVLFSMRSVPETSQEPWAYRATGRDVLPARAPAGAA